MNKEHYRVIDWYKFGDRSRTDPERYTVVRICPGELSGERGKQIEAATVYVSGASEHGYAIAGEQGRALADYAKMEWDILRDHIWWDNEEGDRLIAQLREQGHTVEEEVRDYAGFLLVPGVDRSSQGGPKNQPNPPSLRLVLKDTKMKRPEVHADAHILSMRLLRLLLEVGVDVYIPADRGVGDTRISNQIFQTPQ